MSSFFTSSSASKRSASEFYSFQNLRHITPSVQAHLKRVYATLCVALAAAALGVYMHILWNIGGLLTLGGFVIASALLFVLPVSEENKRVGLLTTAALLQGASIGPLVQAAWNFDPSIIVSAFAGTAIAFGCFSGAAIVAKRREFFYLGGLISAGLSILLWLQFSALIFGHSAASYKMELYFGLLIFMGYIVYDTQAIIEKAHLGDMDYVKHALTLFTDFVSVLLRIIHIMMKNKSEKKSDEKKKRRYC